MPETPNFPYDVRKAMRHLRRVDPAMGRLISRIGPCRVQLAGHKSPFEALLRAIFYQQLHGKAAATILQRFKDRFGAGNLPAPEQVLAAETRHLRDVGLSRQKIAAIRDLAAKTIDGTVPSLAEVEKLPDDDIIERLTAVRGVGVWTVEMLLLSQLGRPDVLAISDYGLRNGFRIAYRKRRMPKPKELLAFGERWRPYRSVASWYLWRAVDAEVQARAKKPRKGG
ncbi:MAG: DNA-3-methyladenine glycosylase family protein [Candidatus Acidiferrales bacterium]